jgi:hypothetical protein
MSSAKEGNVSALQQKPHADNLRNWLTQRSRQNVLLPSVRGPDSVTLAAYHFWNENQIDSQFDCLASAVRETWHQCGVLKTVLIVNRITRKLEDFAAASDGAVRFDLCPDLIPGNLYSMSVDCISRLCDRFNTDQVLVVQNDGFPIRPGLESFLGTYDYLGAPWQFEKDDRITRFLLRHRGDVGNGGFSLRSKRLCEMTARYYRRKYKLIPHCYLMTEDYFICKTLPSFEKHYRDTVRIAPPEVAATFSLENNLLIYDAVCAHPFGFHGAFAFAHLCNEGQIPEPELCQAGVQKKKP